MQSRVTERDIVSAMLFTSKRFTSSVVLKEPESYCSAVHISSLVNSSLLDTKNSAPNKLIHDDLKRGLYVESAFNIYIYIYIF